VIRTMPGMPAGVIGLEAVGRVSDLDNEQALVPAVRSALERGDVRLSMCWAGVRLVLRRCRLG
jgi:hypothetical protein